MEYEISSGNGPAECELAVTKLAAYLVKNYGARIVRSHAGYNRGTYKTVTISSEKDLSEFTGSVLWVCKSIYRTGHKRKNWFISFSRTDVPDRNEFDPEKVIFSTFRSGGNGGQNVNKVETGVRAIYAPTGDMTVCTDERSQYANKKKALARLAEAVKGANTAALSESADKMRKLHVNLERGNASARFDGIDFKRIY